MKTKSLIGDTWKMNWKLTPTQTAEYCQNFFLADVVIKMMRNDGRDVGEPALMVQYV